MMNILDIISYFQNHFSKSGRKLTNVVVGREQKREIEKIVKKDFVMKDFAGEKRNKFKGVILNEVDIDFFFLPLDLLKKDHVELFNALDIK